MVWALPLWSLFVWGTRIRNVAEDDSSATSLIVPVLLTVLAVAALVDRRRGIPLLAAATVAVWAVRLPMVVVHDHSVGFKVVHAALAVVSIVLAYTSWRALTRRPVLAAR